MSKVAFEQLKQVKNTFIDLSNPDRLEFFIPKYEDIKLEINKSYRIHINKYLVNNNNSVISINWNNSTSPLDSELLITVKNILNMMILVDSISNNGNNKWSGWLPIQDIQILSREV